MWIFLKGLIVLLLNIGVGYMIPFPLKAALFLPRTPKFWKGKQIPFTPGFLYRKKKWLIDKLNGWLNDYLTAAANESDETSFLYNWEQKVYKRVWDTLEENRSLKRIPTFLREPVLEYSSLIVYELVKQFFRSFVPFLAEKFQVASYVELINRKLDVDLLYEYFHRYVYRWVRLFFVVVAALVGIFNMILFWIFA